MSSTDDLQRSHRLSPPPSPSSSALQPGPGGGARRGREKLDTEGNILWISAYRRLLFQVDIALRLFAKHELIELHGLGDAIAPAIEVAEHLIGNQRATLTKISTHSVARGRGSPKADIVIELKRTATTLHTDDESAYIAMTESQHQHTE